MQAVKSRTTFALLTLVLLAGLALLAPAQLPVILFKAALVSTGALLAYWLDHLLFPHLRADAVGLEPVLRAAVTLRRALLVLAAILGMGLAL